MKLHWRLIPGYDDYEMSNFGNIRHSDSQNWIPQWKNSSGYNIAVIRNEYVEIEHLVNRAFALSETPIMRIYYYLRSMVDEVHEIIFGKKMLLRRQEIYRI